MGIFQRFKDENANEKKKLLFDFETGFWKIFL